VSWNAHGPRGDKRQNAAELSIGPCALVWKDTLLFGTVHAAGKSQESRGVSHGTVIGSQAANSSDRLNIGRGPHQWLGGGLDRACRAWQGMAKGTTLLAILWLLSWARRKEHSLISTPRMRVRRLQSIAALTCLCGIAFRSAAPHSPTLAMGARKRCMQWYCQPNCCNNGLRMSPGLRERIFYRCILRSRPCWRSPQRPASNVCTRLPW
jgi:hypothetical protein